MTRFANFDCVAFCIIALLLSGKAYAAEISLSLNLEFNDPHDFDTGGNWTVVAKADERGIAGLVLNIEASTVNFNPATGLLTPAGFEIATSHIFGSRLEIGLFDNLTDPTLDVGVIGGTYPSYYVDDPSLQVIGANPDLGSFSGGVELAMGSFDPGVVPDWYDEGNDFSKANLFDDDASIIGIIAASSTIRYLVNPEPTSATLTGCAVLGLLGHRRRRL